MLDPSASQQTDAFPRFGADSNRSSDTEKVNRFGDYELLEEIARGGMGIVYRARQVSLDRIVAVKMLLDGALAGKDFVQRFRTEAAAAASLQHVNIVAIHEVGFAEGQHFFAMDYVNGLTLAQLVAKGRCLPAGGHVSQGHCGGDHFAHERNVLRDLKPSNVLIDSATDQPRDGLRPGQAPGSRDGTDLSGQCSARRTTCRPSGQRPNVAPWASAAMFIRSAFSTIC